MRHALTLCLLLAAPFSASGAAGAPSKKPNIVVILADDLGYGDVQCYNRAKGKIPTPYIDRLASQGMRFTDGHSSSGVCSPSRYTLLTGRYHWRTKLQAGIVGVFGPPLIAPDRMTIASLLRGLGYRTGCIGKWHLGWDWPINGPQRKLLTGPKDDKAVATEEHQKVWREIFSKKIEGGPTARGFDVYFGTDVPNWPPFCFIDNDRTVGIPTEFLPARLFKNNQASMQGPALKDWKLEPILPAIGDRAVDFVKKSAKAGEPFLLYMPLTAPHTPLAVNEAWKGKSGLNAYADFVMETDAVVGRVLEALEKSGVAENTLVIFTSDNGCAPYIGVLDLIRLDPYSRPRLGRLVDGRRRRRHPTLQSRGRSRPNEKPRLRGTETTGRHDGTLRAYYRQWPQHSRRGAEKRCRRASLSAKGRRGKKEEESEGEVMNNTLTDGGHRMTAGMLITLVFLAADPDFTPDQSKLPAPPPKDAIVLLDGKGNHSFLSMAGEKINWPVEDGVLVSTPKGNKNHIVSKLHFRDADIHVEFMLPEKGTGNSGVYIHGNYEVQILNSHGKEKPTQDDAGAVYGFSKPLVNACRKPGEWQVFDIRYRAPRRDESGKIVENGTVTVWFNGKKVQDGATFGEPKSVYHPFRYGTTPYLEKIRDRQKKTMTGPVFLQDHGNPVKFRNVWVRPLDDHAFIYDPDGK